jgi:geranylgeranylglycerol-phosphate geranylgeranyltransferase
MFSKSKILAWLNIIRIGNSIALGIAAVIGYILGGGHRISDMTKLFAIAFFIGGGGNIINDYYDRDIDAVNKPWRPIPSGLIKPNEAFYTSIAFFIVGTTLAFTVGLGQGFIAVLASALAFLYSYKLKRVLILNNMIIAFLTALAILFGATACQITIHSIIASIYAFLFNLGREFLKGIEDVEGDKKFGVATLATVYGPRIAYIASLIVFASLISLSLLPVILYGYGLVYTILALVVDAVVVHSLIISRNLMPEKTLRATRELKIAVFAGLLAFAFHGI